MKSSWKKWRELGVRHMAARTQGIRFEQGGWLPCVYQDRWLGGDDPSCQLHVFFFRLIGSLFCIQQAFGVSRATCKTPTE
jgi:hypothetical protein